jgi:nitrate/nitrite-specific signal transduction histidine kinase
MQERATLIGGRLWIESVPGRGTAVTLYLPQKMLTTDTAENEVQWQ